MQKIVFLFLYFAVIFAQNNDPPQNGYDPNWFTPDIVTPKHDPFDLISSNFGQPAGQFNWNADQWQLMNRTKRTCNGCTRGGRDVAIRNLTLFVQDEEFLVKAMCYTPVPLGIKTNGGFCSQRRTPYAVNDFEPACFDSDYFHGDNSVGRVPAGPANGWFTSLWQRDFPIIKKSGANTIRLYNTNPTTRLYTELVLNGTMSAIGGVTIVAPPYGSDHRSFMDAAYEAGLMVIWPLLGDQTLMTYTPQDSYQQYLMNQIDEIGDHPALLMYLLGNEMPVAQDADLMAKVNQYIDFSRQYSLSKWGRSIPITHALVDDPFTYDQLYSELHVDIFSSNAGYRGLGFSDLWDGSQTPGFSGFGPLAQKYNKPNFIGEMGWMQVNGSQTSQPQNQGWFNLKWRDLIQKGITGGCVGGAFFEYIDEMNSKADPEQQTMGIVSVRVSSITDMPGTGGGSNVPGITWSYPALSTQQNASYASSLPDQTSQQTLSSQQASLSGSTWTTREVFALATMKSANILFIIAILIILLNL